MQSEIDYKKMSNNEEIVWSIVGQCKGKENSITQMQLAGKAELHPRAGRIAIKSLVEVHRKPICSSYEKDGGYYIANNDAEIDETCDKLYGHAMSILKRLSIFKKVDFHKLQKDLFNEIKETRK